MRNDVHMRDGVAILLLILMMVLVTLPVRRDNGDTRAPANAWYPKKAQSQYR